MLASWPDDDGDRGYHNIAVLLKDARVLVGGGRELVKDSQGTEVYRIGCERTDVRVFTPPYLLKGIRPTLPSSNGRVELSIGGAPAEFKYAGPELKPSQDGGAVLMALGAETHHFDQNQRRVVLKFEKTPSGLRIFPPETSWIAPEGFYNLFLVSRSGIPSQGLSVRLSSNK